MWDHCSKQKANPITDIEITANQQNQQKPLKELEVVPNPVDVEPVPIQRSPSSICAKQAA